MLNLSLNELKLVVAKSRGIKGYKSMSEEKLTKILSNPESKISYLKLRIEEIREEFNKLRDRLTEP